MITARTFVRFAIAGLMVNALAVACVVENNGDSCDAGEYKDCTCPDDFVSEKQCNDDGDAWGKCDCVGHEAGGGGTSNAGGDGNTDTAGGGNTSTAGTAGTAGTSYGGDAAGGAPGDTGGVAAVNGGAGGMPGEELPLECQDATDDCEVCYFGGCCDDWAPCVNDETCLTEFNDVLACTNEIKGTRDVKTADLEACAQDVGQTNGTWSASLSDLTVNMVNCVAGEPGWEGSPWGNLACKASCFDK